MSTATASPRPRFSRGPLSPEQQALIGPELIEMAERMAIAASRHAPWRRDDLVSSALFGLTLAARRFDRGGPVPFRAYAIRRVKGTLLTSVMEDNPAGYRGPGEWREAPRTYSIDSPTVAAGTPLIDSLVARPPSSVEADPPEPSEPPTPEASSMSVAALTNARPPLPGPVPVRLPPGVRKIRKSSRYEARVQVAGERRWLGSYGTPEEAAAALEAAKAGPAPKAKSGRKPRTRSGDKPAPRPEASSPDPIALAEAILAATRILAPLDRPTRASVVEWLRNQLVGPA